MGIAASIAEEHSLFESLTAQYNVSSSEFDLSAAHSESESDEEYANTENTGIPDSSTSNMMETKRIAKANQALYESTSKVYNKWRNSVNLKHSTIFSQLIDFEESLDTAFKTGRTPLILDTSEDDKICTFFSYQPDVVILDAKSLVMLNTAGSTKNTKSMKNRSLQNKNESNRLESRLVAMDIARKALVNAMKFGKLLVIRLGTSAPDFVHTFSDEALGIDNTQGSSAYFPSIVFEKAGSLLHDAVVDFGESRKQPPATASETADTATARAPMQSTVADDGDESEQEKRNPIDAGIATTPTTATHTPPTDTPPATIILPPTTHSDTHSAKVRTPSWAERLFREEDMKPHKNFALCRKEFRVCVTSQLPLDQIQEFLFGMVSPDETNHESNDNNHGSKGGQNSNLNADYQGSLPNIDLFKIISILPDEPIGAGADEQQN